MRVSQNSRAASRNPRNLSPVVTLDKEMYTLQEAADVLGVSLSGITKWCHDGTLPVVRLGSRRSRRKTIRVTRNVLEAFVNEGVAA